MPNKNSVTRIHRNVPKGERRQVLASRCQPGSLSFLWPAQTKVQG